MNNRIFIIHENKYISCVEHNDIIGTTVSPYDGSGDWWSDIKIDGIIYDLNYDEDYPDKISLYSTFTDSNGFLNTGSYLEDYPLKVLITIETDIDRDALNYAIKSHEEIRRDEK